MSLEGRVEALERLVDHLLTHVDRRPVRDGADARVGRAIAEATSGRAFTGRELMRHRTVDPSLSATLAEALIDSPRQLGKALRRIETMEDSGVIVERVRVDHRAIVWRVRVWRA
jgi:hypothetical protein